MKGTGKNVMLSGAGRGWYSEGKYQLQGSSGTRRRAQTQAWRKRQVHKAERRDGRFHVMEQG